MTVKAIQTRYKGYHFRSRLEARWAVFFDALGIEWEYEPEGFETAAGKYLPDFRIFKSLYVEVKPDSGLSDLDDALRWVRFVEGGGNLLLVTGHPESKWYPVLQKSGPDGDESLWVEYIDLLHSVWKGRPWYSYGEADDPANQGISWPEFVDAVVAARSARFEHGQSGAT